MLLRALKSFLVPLNLADLTSVEAKKLTNSWYEVINSSPTFVADRVLNKGWYMIESQIVGSGSLEIEILLKDLEEGELHSLIRLHSPNGKMLKKLFYVEKPVRFNALKVLQKSGRFHFEHFKLSRVTSGFARKRMVSKIVNTHPDLNHKARKGVINQAKSRQNVLGKTDSKSSLPDYPLAGVYEIYLECFYKFDRQSRNYNDWLKYQNKNELTNLDMDIESISKKYLISVLMPVYKPNLGYLVKAIESLRNQIYTNWELCIADDFSDDQEVIEYLKSLQSEKIKVCFRSENGNISAASNSALELCTGKFVLLMDQDDELSINALYELVKSINENPQVKLVYSDEDKIDEKGKRFDGHFKPEFSPDLLLGQNYISHLTVLERDLIESLGGFRVGFEGSQDHDLLLRCLPSLTSENVVRIPKVLYHWRAIQGSTALQPGEKTYTQSSGLRALNDYLSKNELDATAEAGLGSNTYRVRWAIKAKPLVSLLIPTRDRLDVLKPCIDSILKKTSYENYEIIILDNDSVEADTLEYFESLKSNSNIKIEKISGSFNFSRINNVGARAAKGEVLGLVNNDIEVIDGNWLDELASQALRKGIGCVGAKLLYTNGNIQHGGVILGLGGAAGHSHLHKKGDSPGYFEKMNLVHNVSAVTGACLFIKKDIYQDVGGLDERFAVAFNDIDFCIRVMNKGFRNIWTPFATLYHHESISRGYEDTPQKKQRFKAEVNILNELWGNLLSNDPYYNPNFDLKAESYCLKQNGEIAND